MLQATIIRLLASDLDGTLIPHHPQHASKSALKKFISVIKNNPDLSLCYATGRHFELALDGINKENLPLPNYLVCDVGTSIYRRTNFTWALDSSYSDKMKSLLGADSISAIEPISSSIPNIRLQEKEKQSNFKLSYYVEPEVSFQTLRTQLDSLLSQSDYRPEIIISRSSSDEMGLLDILPTGANKALALNHILEVNSISESETIYAGDSRNDEAVFLSEISSIAVANIGEELRRELASKISNSSSLYFAASPCIAGVVEGLTHFKLLPNAD